MGAVARLFVFCACLTVATSSSAFAQQRGSITGKVVDPDGLPLPGADGDGDTVGDRVHPRDGDGRDRRLLGAEPRAWHLHR